MLVDFHAELESHALENFFDFVKRLTAEVFRFEHLGFRLRYKLADGANVRVLQTIVRANRKFQLVHRLIEVLAGRIVTNLSRLFYRLFFLFKLNEDLHVILDQLRSKTERVLRSDGTV